MLSWLFGIKNCILLLMPAKFLLLFIITFLVLIPREDSFAQSEVVNQLGIGMSSYYEIPGEVNVGDIIIQVGNHYKRSFQEYQEGVVGVVVKDPALAIDPQIDGTYPVLTSGEVLVNVNNSNGEINAGDYVTTSAIEGEGMKMSDSGFKLGIARQTVREFDENGKSKIIVQIDTKKIEPKKDISSAMMLLKPMYSRVSEAQGTFKIVKYFVSGSILLVTLVFLVVNLKRISQEGIKALGRNPLASKVIVFNVFLNLLITICITVGGIALSYFLLVI